MQIGVVSGGSYILTNDCSGLVVLYQWAARAEIGAQQVKVNPFHTSVPEYGGERNVYHNNNACQDGKRIKPEHRTPGTAGRPPCKECARL